MKTFFNRVLPLALLALFGLIEVARASQPFQVPFPGNRFDVLESYKMSAKDPDIDADVNITVNATYTLIGKKSYTQVCRKASGGTYTVYEYIIDGTFNMNGLARSFTYELPNGFPFAATNLEFRAINQPFGGSLLLREGDLATVARVREMNGTFEAFDQSELEWVPAFTGETSITEEFLLPLDEHQWPLTDSATSSQSLSACTYFQWDGSVDFLDFNITDHYTVVTPYTADTTTTANVSTMSGNGSCDSYVMETVFTPNGGTMRTAYCPDTRFMSRQEFENYPLETLAIIDEASIQVLNYQDALYAKAVGDVTFSSAASCLVPYTIDVYGASGTTPGSSLGTFTCGPGGTSYTPGATNATMGPVLLYFSGNVPDFACGDSITLDITGWDPVTVPLPIGAGTNIGTGFYLWVESDGSTLYAKSGSNRTGGVDQTIWAAIAAEDYATDAANREVELVTTPASDYSFYFYEQCLPGVSMASDLKDLLDDLAGSEVVSTISYWNSVSQSFQTFVPRPPLFIIGDFPIVQGMVLRIEAYSGATVTLAGLLPMSGDISYVFANVVPGRSAFHYFGLPSYTTSLTTAQDICLELENGTGIPQVYTFDKWNNVSQTWTQYIHFFRLGDFPVTPGNPYRFEALGTGFWTPGN